MKIVMALLVIGSLLWQGQVSAAESVSCDLSYFTENGCQVCFTQPLDMDILENPTFSLVNTTDMSWLLDDTEQRDPELVDLSGNESSWTSSLSWQFAPDISWESFGDWQEFVFEPTSPSLSWKIGSGTLSYTGSGSETIGLLKDTVTYRTMTNAFTPSETTQSLVQCIALSRDIQGQDQEIMPLDAAPEIVAPEIVAPEVLMEAIDMAPVSEKMPEVKIEADMTRVQSGPTTGLLGIMTLGIGLLYFARKRA